MPILQEMNRHVGKKRGGKMSRWAFAFVALSGGLTGGLISGALTRSASVQAQGPVVIRATAVELVNNAGNRVGLLGTDERHNTSLAFFDARGTKRAEIGLVHGVSPRIDINGPDGDSLLSLDLGQKSKPRLMMSEHEFNGRVYLGVAEPDAPDPQWKYDSWVLRFTGDKTRPLAIIGMTTGRSGGVAVFDQAGHSWRTPLK
jgi:hypothetical protein